MTVTFCGHGDTPSSDDIKTWLVENIEALLASGDRDHILSGVFNQFLSEKSEPAE